jgi:hypothetical protein
MPANRGQKSDLQSGDMMQIPQLDLPLIRSIATDGEGGGNGLFDIRIGADDKAVAFDMYPEGAPKGNKYQSVRISPPGISK